MRHFKVLGSGCTNCQKTAALIEQVAHQLAIEVRVEKVTDLTAILHYQVMSTPAVVENEQAIHAGSVPNENMIRGWLNQPVNP
ncbi:thioredoxin family protein [Vibrio fluvialis]|uniref:thioredoxin family protein n=1 Tax=Vibrio fluvialis TaxID=676 RepID=UPI001EECA3D0|nr:thioredoxin family protein [Vibrio fluvialis]MCG6403330.1 thioredoxin family protein [Vibrio fluvialis]